MLGITQASAIRAREWNGYALREATGPLAPAREISNVETWGWLPAIALVGANGLFLMALANRAARFEYDWAPLLMYVGLIVLFAPVAARLFAAAPARRERIGLVVTLAVILYLVKLLPSPAMFTGFDELLHWHTAQEIVSSGHLFSGNSLLPISPLYPGLEIVTSAVVRLTGLTIFEAGALVVGVARVLLALALFLFFEEISQSARLGGIAALLYTTNLNFITFDAQYAYESLALPLGVFALFLIARRLRQHETHAGATLALLLTISAIVVTHHLTSFVFVAFLVLLLAAGFLTRQSAAERMDMARIVAFSITAAVGWLFLIAPTVVYYLSPYTVGAVRQMVGLIFSEAVTRPLFSDYAGLGTPIWERAISLSSVALVLLGLPWGLLRIWRRYRGYLRLPSRRAAAPSDIRIVALHTGAAIMPLALGLASLAYGLTLPLRLLPSGAEVSARSAGFLFLAIAFVLTLGPVESWLSRLGSWKRSAVLTLWATILFTGGYILGAGPPWARLPGPYLVAADARSIEPEGIAAANWAFKKLGPGNRIAADRVNGLLMGSYGSQRPISDVGDQLDVAPVYFSREFGKQDQAILDKGQVEYVVVDRRLSKGLPRVGVYFQSVEPGAYLHKNPIPLDALAKFDQLKNMSRVFDSGEIVVYEVLRPGRPNGRR
ncbi:MAG: hypothetical protein HY782_16380 [Chloroflexi bacterium]|nr:hypothetical protein [Chloroflexota bacterium]